MSDVKLLPGEEIVWEARIAWVAYIYAIVMFLALLVMRDLSSLATTRLTLTNKRVIGSRGLVYSKMLDVSYDQIASVHVARGLFGTIFDFGTVTILTKNGRKFACHSIAEPLYVQMQIEEAIEIAVLGYKLSDYVGDANV